MSALISMSFDNVATLVAAATFLVGGFVNVSARRPIREEFVRYGFPWWWCWVTALLEFMTAVLLIMRPTFVIGITIGVCIMVAAIVAIIRARDFRHIPPPAAFLLLLFIAAVVNLIA